MGYFLLFGLLFMVVFNPLNYINLVYIDNSHWQNSQFKMLLLFQGHIATVLAVRCALGRAWRVPLWPVRL